MIAKKNSSFCSNAIYIFALSTLWGAYHVTASVLFFYFEAFNKRKFIIMVAPIVLNALISIEPFCEISIIILATRATNCTTNFVRIVKELNDY